MKIIIILIVVILVIALFVYNKKKATVSQTPIEVAIANLPKIEKVMLNRQLSFASDVVAYFKKLQLNPKNDTPFILDASVMGQKTKNFPKVDIGIMLGVYHEQSNTLTDFKLLVPESLDNQTKEVLSQGENGIVVLG